MKQAVAIIGIGEMAGVFARGFLRAGYPVYPIRRTDNLNQALANMPEPLLVLLAVGEKDLHASLDSIDARWYDKLALLQNELLPRDWQAHQIDKPSVISVWFEKKKGMDFKVLISSPAYGPNASVLVEALTAIGIDANEVPSAADMEYELVNKNVYILTTNIAGLRCGGDVEFLWNENHQLALDVIDDVISIQEFLTGKAQDKQRLIAGFEKSVQGDLRHQCMGRSAPARLARAMAIADEAGLPIPTLRTIAAEQQ